MGPQGYPSRKLGQWAHPQQSQASLTCEALCLGQSLQFDLAQVGQEVISGTHQTKGLLEARKETTGVISPGTHGPSERQSWSLSSGDITEGFFLQFLVGPP